MREYIDNQHPIVIDIEYDLKNKTGFIYRLDLHNNKVLTHIHIYMWTKYGKRIKIIEDKSIKSIIFDDDEIIINFTEDDYYLENVLAFIQSENTFIEFLNMFKDDFFYLKHAHKHIKYYDENEELYGIEIEMIINPDMDNVETRNKLLNNLKNKYHNQIYICTEDLRDHFIEINNYPMKLENFYKLWYVIKYVEENGMTFNDTSNIHIHVNKEIIGNNINEIKENINKLLVFFYHIDDFIYKEMSTKKIDDWKVCSTIKYVVDKYVGHFNFERVLDDLLVEANIINENERPLRLNYYRLLSEYEEENTFEFRLSTILDSKKETFFKLICFVEYCVKEVIKKDLNEVNELTIEDFYNYYNKKDFTITDF